MSFIIFYTEYAGLKRWIFVRVTWLKFGLVSTPQLRKSDHLQMYAN